MNPSMFPEGVLPDHLKEFFEKARGVIEVPMGSVGVNASREALDYNKITLAYLATTLATLGDLFNTHLESMVAHLSGYLRRRELRNLANIFGIKKLKDIDLFSPLQVPTGLKSFNFHIPRQRKGNRQRDPMTLDWFAPLKDIPWDTEVLWLKDIPIERHQVDKLLCVVPKPGLAIDRVELDAVLAAMDLTGITLRSISERLQFEKPVSTSKPHYSKTHFRHIEGKGLEGTSCWLPLTENEVPVGGVYVWLTRYKPDYDIQSIDQAQLAACAIVPPVLYGVKVLEVKPVVIGPGAIHYPDWVRQQLDLLWEDKRLAYLMQVYANSKQAPQVPPGFHPAHPIGHLGSHARAFKAATGLRLFHREEAYDERKARHARERAAHNKKVDVRHPCPSRERFAKLVSAFQSLNATLRHPRYEASNTLTTEVANLAKRYPLLMTDSQEFYHFFLNKHQQAAVHQYVNLIDKENPL